MDQPESDAAGIPMRTARIPVTMYLQPPSRDPYSGAYPDPKKGRIWHGRGRIGHDGDESAARTEKGDSHHLPVAVGDTAPAKGRGLQTNGGCHLFPGEAHV